MPLRKPFSCPPPCSSGCISTRLSKISAAAPCGPRILWLDIVIACTFKSEKSTLILPKPCTASVCIKAPAARTASAIAAMSCITPVSLFANITETKLVGTVSCVVNCAKSSLPLASTAIWRLVEPNCCIAKAGRVTHGCSIALLKTCIIGLAPAMPFTAKLLASVPLAVKTTCEA